MMALFMLMSSSPVRSFRLTMDRAKRLPPGHVVSQYIADDNLDRISKLSLCLQAAPDKVNRDLAADLLDQELDMSLCICTVMEAAIDVVREVIVQNQQVRVTG